MRDQIGAAATDRIALDASMATLVDIFGFFNGRTLGAEANKRKEDSRA